MAPKIVITNRVHDDVIALLEPHCRLSLNQTQEPWSCEQLLEQSRDATGLIAFMTDCIDSKFLSRCPDLRIIASVLKGYDNFDVAACTSAGVWLSVVPDGLSAATAELTIGLMIGIGRHVTRGDAHVRQGYRGWRPIYFGDGLERRTVGILGMGAIGQAVAKRLSGFDCRICYFDERAIAAGQAAALGARRASLEEVLRTSDFVVIALPLNQRTKHLINAASIACMKPGSYIINPARGSIVDEAAVADALESGRLGGYAADVFEMEDWAREDRPQTVNERLIANRDTTILTPHLGSADWRARQAAELEMARSIVDYLHGRVPRGAVNDPHHNLSAALC